MSDRFTLKPCPFCDSQARIGKGVLTGVFFVQCLNVLDCGCQTRFCKTKEAAVEAWNKRVHVAPVPPADEVEVVGGAGSGDSKEAAK